MTRTGRASTIEGGTAELVFARDALRIAIATERSGLEFYTRAASLTRDSRGRRVFEKLATEPEDVAGQETDHANHLFTAAAEIHIRA